MNEHSNPSVTASPCHLPLHKGGFFISLDSMEHFTFSVVWKNKDKIKRPQEEQR